MNIYDYFNSRDIAAHCQKIGHQFTATEMAYIVWHSNHHTLADKHTAWQEIIDTMPDENFPTNWYFANHTLHSFLQTYMRVQHEYIEEFCTTDKHYVYTYAALESNSSRYSLNHIFFDNYEACLQALQAIGNDEIIKAKITRHRVYSVPVSSFEAQEQESIVFDRQLRPLDLWTTWDAEGEKRLLCPSWGFYDMWVAIPTPFQKGDVVIDVDAYDDESQRHVAFVLDVMPHWQKTAETCDGWTDMLASAYRKDCSGANGREYEIEYLNLEYAREEQTT